MQRLKYFSGMAVFWALLAIPTACFACDAGTEGYTRAAQDLEPITVIRNGEIQSLSLIEAYGFLMHPCLTGTVGFLAAAYGLDLLFGDETPVVEDVMVFSLSPGGSMNALDFIFKGDSSGDKTWPPVGAQASGDNFVYTFLRKSTSQSVTVRLREGLWPDDWFVMREKQHAGTITDAQSKKRDADRTRVLERFPAMEYAELFGKPNVYTFMAWGHMAEGELDRHIRDQRRQARNKDRN